MTGFIAVHVGAGVHSEFLWPVYKNACKSACNRAVELLHDGCDSTTAVAAAVEVLEDCPATNAGIGSSLSLQRTIECDAAIMDGSSLNFGSVGAMPYIKNPIQVARKIVEVQTKGLSYNRIPPNTLVGEGATQWAEEHGFAGNANLLTDQSEHTFIKYYNIVKKYEEDIERIYLKRELRKERKRHETHLPVVKEEVIEEYSADLVRTPSPALEDNAEDSVRTYTPPLKRMKASEVEAFSEDANLEAEIPKYLPVRSYTPECILLDTVGAVCVDSSGNVSSAVSSGGIVLKSSGRVGQAAVYGAGCWAQNSSSADKPSIGTSVTGVGEYLTKTLFAKECYQAMYERDNSISTLPDVIRDRFINSPFLKNATASKQAGVILVQHYAEDNRCELGWAHNSKTMILGYGSTSSKKTHEIVSVLPEHAVVGESVAGGFECVRFTS